MTETLTESFCERCGTRYTFEPVRGRSGPLQGIGTLGRGLRHFIADPGTTLDEALAVARSEQEQRATSTALEAFHQTFNFCLSCRQYTCGDCWNAVEGRCLTCAPVDEAPDALAGAATFEPLSAVAPVPVADPPRGHAPAVADVGAFGAAAEPEVPEAGSEEVEAPEGIGEQVTEAVPDHAEGDGDERQPIEPEASEPQPLEVERQPEATFSFEPGVNLDEAIAAYEQSLAAPEGPASQVDRVSSDGEQHREPEAPAGDLRAVEAEGAAAPAPVAETVPEPVEPEQPPPAALEPIPTAVGTPLPAPPEGAVSWPLPEVAAAALEPHWPDAGPAGPAGPAGTAAPMHPDVSSRAIASAPVSPAIGGSVALAGRTCPACGLSLSASARFCRRCGTPQQPGAAT